jgi:hypothetical protein
MTPLLILFVVALAVVAGGRRWLLRNRRDTRSIDAYHGARSTLGHLGAAGRAARPHAHVRVLPLADGEPAQIRPAPSVVAAPPPPRRDLPVAGPVADPSARPLSLQVPAVRASKRARRVS